MPKFRIIKQLLRTVVIEQDLSDAMDSSTVVGRDESHSALYRTCPACHNNRDGSNLTSMFLERYADLLAAFVDLYDVK
jgi:hypothetical protein